MKYLVSFLLALVVLGISFNLTLGPASNDTTSKNFVINQGDGLSSISSRLHENGLIKNKYTFLIVSRYLKLNNKLQAGMFKLAPSMSTSEIITKLSTSGSLDYWLKIIEGQRVAELKTSFDPSLEGFLFPDSYLIPQNYSNAQIVSLIKKNFDQKFMDAKVGATNLNLSDTQIIILASIIEREARSLKSKQSVSGVLLNRIQINMALQVDASIQYARDSRLKPKIFWTPATKSDLEINSLYNTYHNPGLPPGPICNPGYDSIYAALHPTASDYLYYITGNDNQMHYAKTLDEHNANIAKYLK